ncbi:hypothetical protein RclHR1_38420002 [Rhizophagus clarus]|uniref:Uncharacterized protein n=1 Tax=Rhizophagus clarus TaxID=94130 RepID=A0A2Z6S809_9GLOM|nr:hypothetical protein RclHR1_38420002 [Rhizophagus clarus]
MEYQLFNSCGDRIIKLINKSRQEAEKNPLPINIKEGRRFLDVNKFPYMKFKKVFIMKFQDKDYSFYYQPIIHGIKVLLLQSEMNEKFVFKYKNHNTLIKTYSEQFEIILADMVEAGAFTTTYLPSTSKRSCYYCLINNKDLNNMALSYIDLRIPEKMKLAISENQASEFSIHKEFNYFWDFDDFNIYEVTAPHRIHLLDLRITKYLIKFTHELLH